MGWGWGSTESITFNSSLDLHPSQALLHNTPSLNQFSLSHSLPPPPRSPHHRGLFSLDTVTTELWRHFILCTVTRLNTVKHGSVPPTVTVKTCLCGSLRLRRESGHRFKACPLSLFSSISDSLPPAPTLLTASYSPSEAQGELICRLIVSTEQ